MTTQPTLLDLLDQPRATTSTPRSQWLTNHLIAAGNLTESGLTRRARIRTCSCGATILAGLDNDTCAFEATTDPIPLGTLGEMLAHLEHRRTYDLRREAGGWVLDHRDHRRITAHPATTRPRIDVVRQHHCHTRPVSEPETAPTAFAEAKPPAPTGSHPPF